MSKRKYNPEYIKYGFIANLHRGEYLPQCIVCMKTLSNGAMKPSLSKRHLESTHPDKKDKNESYFERLDEHAKMQRLDQTGQNYKMMAGIVKASYEVSLLVAQNTKAHIIAVVYRIRNFGVQSGGIFGFFWIWIGYRFPFNRILIRIIPMK